MCSRSLMRRKEVLKGTNRLLYFHHILSTDTDRIENTASNSFYIVTCVFIATETCLPSRCLEIAVSSELSGIRRDTHTHRQQGGLMKLLTLFKIRKEG
jgi:hypothetical protein